MLVNYKVFYKQDGRLIAEKTFDEEKDGCWAGQEWAATQGGWYLESYRPDGSIYCTYIWHIWSGGNGDDSFHRWDWLQFSGNCRSKAWPRYPVDYSDFDKKVLPDDYFINKPRKTEHRYRQMQNVDRKHQEELHDQMGRGANCRALSAG